MRKRSAFARAAAVLGVGLFVGLILLANQPGPPPVLSILSIEPANVIDDAGVEMRLVNLSISNSEAWPNAPIYVKDTGVPVKERLADHWIQAEASLACTLRPFQAHRILLVVPATTDACRVCFKYTDAVVTKGRLAWLA